MTTEADLREQAGKLKVSLYHSIHKLDEVGINEDGFRRMAELIPANRIIEMMSGSLARRIKKIDEDTDHLLKSDLVSAKASAELLQERKHEFRVLRKLSPNYESALVVWLLWVQDDDIDIHSALELCDYFGADKVASAYLRGVGLGLIEQFLNNDIGPDLTKSLLS